MQSGNGKIAPATTDKFLWNLLQDENECPHFHSHIQLQLLFPVLIFLFLHIQSIHLSHIQTVLHTD